jgi:hypothetical protein
MSNESLKPARDVLFIAYVLRTIWILKKGKDNCPTVHEFAGLAQKAEKAIVQERSSKVQMSYLNAVSQWQADRLDPSGFIYQSTRATLQGFTEFLNGLMAGGLKNPPFLESHVPGMILLDALYKGKIFREYLEGSATILLVALELECSEKCHDDINTAWAHVISNGIDSSSAITAEEFFQQP